MGSGTIKILLTVFFSLLILFAFGCKQEKVSCGYDINNMVGITGQIIDTHHYVDTSSNPAPEKIVVTIRTATCDVFALKESIEYQSTKSEDEFLKVHKVCINESGGTVSFKGLYREYSDDHYFYDMTPSYCYKESEKISVKLQEK